jgi:hypothetical protein
MSDVDVHMQKIAEGLWNMWHAIACAPSALLLSGTKPDFVVNIKHTTKSTPLEATERGAVSNATAGAEPRAHKAAAGMALLRATKAAKASLQQKKAAKSAADVAPNAEESPANEQPNFKAKNTSTPSAMLVSGSEAEPTGVVAPQISNAGGSPSLEEQMKAVLLRQKREGPFTGEAMRSASPVRVMI